MRRIAPTLVCAAVLALPLAAVSQERAPSADEANREGIEAFTAGRYGEALAAFERALALLPARPSPLRFDVRLNVANARQMLGELAAARALYEALLRDDPDRAARYQRELDVLRRKEGRSAPDFVRGDPRLARLVRGLLPKFVALTSPIEVRLLAREQNEPGFLRSLGVPTRFVPIAESTTVAGRHLLLYNAEFWAEADDVALAGNLAHELMHREWEELELQGRVFDWTRDTVSWAALEHVIDYAVLGKGLAVELYRAKAYLLARHDERYLRGDLAPNVHHLADVLTRASGFAMEGRADAIPAPPVPPAIAEDVRQRLAAFSWHRR